MALSWTHVIPLTAGGISSNSGGAGGLPRSRRAAAAPVVRDKSWRRESCMRFNPATSFHVHALLLLRLRGRVQLLHDGALTISFDLELQPVIHGGEGDMRFGERRGLLDDQLQIAASGVEFFLA